MRRQLERCKLLGRVTIDSAGIACARPGRRPDLRARACVRRRGGNISDLRSRKLSHEDLEEFDVILVMERQNQIDAMSLAKTHAERSKVQLLGEYGAGGDIGDPAEDGSRAFVAAFDAIERACKGLLEQIVIDPRSSRLSIAVQQ
jgi:protein-tyrosine phosphatase